MDIAGLSPFELTYALVVVFLAAIIRGYTGFGFSALVVLGLSLWLAPAEVVPMVLLLEIVASIHMLPAVWRHIDWYRLGWLLLGSAFSIPLGVYLLASLPETEMRILISTLILAASILIGLGFSIRDGNGRGWILTAGLVSGAMTGAAATGGLAVVVFFLSTSLNPAVSRATLVALFLATDIYSASLAGSHGLVTVDTFVRGGLFLIPLFIGISLGSRQFGRSRVNSLRRLTLMLLIVLSVLGLLRAIY